jgi:Bacterial type II and III secretion system protein/FG-GAP-like repeat
MEILEVDRDYARQLGITPPQSTKIFALNSQEIAEAQQSVQGLVDVITQVFGQPSSLTGLSSSQITSLLNSGQLSLNSLIPPVVAFGGGESTFLATMPGAAANFSQMLSLVQHGRRVLLRAQDGQPASFFVGDRVPVELSNFSASLSGTGTSIAGLSSTNFPTVSYATGTSPTFVATGSLRNNSTNDLIVSNFTDNTISVLLGATDGAFGTQKTFPTGTGPVWIATGSFRAASSNQAIDLAVANQTANTVSILLGNGDGTFAAKTDLAAGRAPSSVIAKNLHDLNGKGNLDLIVANHDENTIFLYEGNGDGTFQKPTTIQLPNGFGPSCVTAADFNGDGHLDLVVTNEGNASVSVFLGNGDGTFGARTDYATGNSPVWVTTGDFNGDTVLDLAVANKADNTVSVLFGNVKTNSAGASSVGNGTFGFQTIYPAGSSPSSIAVADYNIDGLPDLAVAAAGDNAVSVLLNLGSGTFGPNFELPVETNPVSIITADFNGDSRPDVAIANNGSNTVSVILNSSNFSPRGSSSPFSNGAGFPGVQYIDIGLKVKATPRVHLDGEVTLQLDFDISSLSGQSFNTIPVISNDTITQTVRVKENETAVLAGLLQHQLSAALNGTPGIANIPEIGLFAGDQNKQNQDSELLILVTPRMVRYAPRQDHVIYAGQGAIEGPGGAAAGGPVNEGPVPVQPGGQIPPPTPPGGAPGPGQIPPPTPEQPGVPQPTTQVGTPVAPPPQPIQQPPPAPQQPPPQPGPPGPVQPPQNPPQEQPPAQQQQQRSPPQ